MKARISFSHRLEYVAYRSFEAVFRLLPLLWIWHLGAFCGRILSLVPRLRRTVYRNLFFAYHLERPEEERRALSEDAFRHITANLFCALKIPLMAPEAIQETFSMKGVDEINARRSHGSVLIIPHMGNWELLSQAWQFQENQLRVATHYRPLSNPLLDALVVRRRRKKGLDLFPKHSSSHSLVKYIRGGGTLAILADQRIRGRGAVCSFFGRPTVCSPLPSLIARRAKAPIHLLFCRTVAPARWELSFEPLPDHSSQTCASALERAWRSSPKDVFWFHERWKLSASHPFDQLSRPPHPDPELLTNPLRLSSEANPKPEIPLPPSFYQWVSAPDDSPVDRRL